MFGFFYYIFFLLHFLKLKLVLYRKLHYFFINMINIDKTTVEYADGSKKEISLTVEQVMKIFDDIQQGKVLNSGIPIKEIKISMSSK